MLTTLLFAAISLGWAGEESPPLPATDEAVIQALCEAADPVERSRILSDWIANPLTDDGDMARLQDTREVLSALQGAGIVSPEAIAPYLELSLSDDDATREAAFQAALNGDPPPAAPHVEAEQAQETTPPLPLPQGDGPERSLYVMDVESTMVSTGATITEWMVFDDEGHKVRVGEFMRVVGDERGLKKRRIVAGVNLLGTGLSAVGGLAMLRASQEDGRNEDALAFGGATLLTASALWGGATFVVHASYFPWFTRGRAERLCEAYNAGIFEAEER